MRRVLLALTLLFLPLAGVQAARVDQLIEEMARRNRAQDEAQRREEDAEERRRARAEAEFVPAQRAPERRAASSEPAGKSRPARAEVTRSTPRGADQSGGRGSGGCGGRGGPGWRKLNGKCASWQD
jgi:hypothetical protein